MNLYDRAIRAYSRRAKKRGEVPMQPSYAFSRVTEKLIVLKTSNAELARYRIVRNRLRYSA